MSAVGRSIPIPANESIARLALQPAVRRRLRRGFDDFGPDVVHLHEPFQAGVSLYTLSLSDLPAVVGSFHAAAERMRLYDLLRPVLSRLMRRIDVTAAVSPSARDLVRLHFGEEVAARVRILPNGLDTSRFEHRRRGQAGRDQTVLFVGRLERRKGCDVLLKAWPAVAGAFSEWALVILGDGPLRRDLESGSAGLPRVSFGGRVGDDELVEAYGSSQIVCVPSVASESFGIVILEAMASGACVVASDLPGYRWVGGDAAVYFPPGDAAALAARIRELAGSPERMSELSAAGRRRAAEFDWSRLVPAVVSAYEDAICSVG